MSITSTGESQIVAPQWGRHYKTYSRSLHPARILVHNINTHKFARTTLLINDRHWYTLMSQVRQVAFGFHKKERVKTTSTVNECTKYLVYDGHDGHSVGVDIILQNRPTSGPQLNSCFKYHPKFHPNSDTSGSIWRGAIALPLYIL